MKSTALQFVKAFHTRYLSIIPLLQHPLLLLIRLYWGYDFYQSGVGKLNNLENTIEFFASLNIPFPAFNAVFVGYMEMFGGILFLAGFGVRYFTIPLIVNMCVAYATDDREALLNVFSDPESFVAATPFQHLLALLIVYVYGAGFFSIDWLIELWNKRKTSH
ncbi:MAG: DoxX family protein [Bacteroidota bacterium]